MQSQGRLCGPCCGVDPVPGLPTDDGIERPTGRIPGFEGRYFDVDPVAASKFSHPLVDINSDQLTSFLLELPGRNTSADADVEKRGAGAGCDDPTHHGFGVVGPDPVVPFGVRAE